MRWHAVCDGWLIAGDLIGEAWRIRIVDKDRTEGPLKEAGGKAKEAWGDLTDDPGTEAEGKKDQIEGKVQNEWGEAKDNVRDAADGDR